MLKFLNRQVINAKFNIEDICNIYRRLHIEAGDDSDTLSYIQFMNAILPPAAITGTLLSGNTSPVSLSPEPLKRSIHSKATLMSGNASKSKLKFANEVGKTSSKSPRRPDSSMRNMESHKRLQPGSQRSASGFESIEPAPPREDKYRTATNAIHKKNAQLYRQVWEQQQTAGFKSQASSKMQMLISSIAEPTPPDPFGGLLPMSRYK